MTHVNLTWGGGRLDVEVAERNLVGQHRGAVAAPLPDLAGAVRQALEEPLGFPPLRRALTPDDHVAIAVDERIPHLSTILVPLLEHLRSAQVTPDAMTLVCLPPSTGQPWADELPEEFQEVRMEVHQPEERRTLSYLATTRRGRRIYLNRTAVDADQLVLLTRRAYDPFLGVTGAETALFPALADEATLKEVNDKLALKTPGKEANHLRQEAVEVAWLLGVPFLVQVVEGAGDEVLHVLGGTVENSATGERLLQARWQVEVDRPADVVVASLGGDPARQSFEDLARAFHCASRVVKPGGRVVLLCASNPPLGPGAAMLRKWDEPAEALKDLLKDKLPDWTAGYLWAGAAQRAKLYLLSGLAAETVEELFATPLEQPGQVQRLLGKEDACLFLPDAHKTLAVVQGM